MGDTQCCSSCSSDEGPVAASTTSPVPARPDSGPHSAEECPPDFRPRLTRRVLPPPRQDIGPLDVPSPTGRLDNGTYKTRISRVLARTIAVPSGTSDVKYWFTLEQMQRSARRDSAHGIVYLLIRASGELSADLQFVWEIPCCTNEYEYGVAVNVPFNSVESAKAWSGPTPGRVGFTLTFTNLGAATSANVTVDLCAKRRGGNFMRGHWIRDPLFDAVGASTSLGVYDPDPEGRRMPKGRPAKSCGQVAAKAGAKAALAVGTGSNALHSGGQRK